MVDLRSAVIEKHVQVVSTDLFDTILLRDGSTQVSRLREASFRAAGLLGLDPEVLTRLRWRLQADAYRAVTLERPTGEASLQRISTVAATALGLEAAAAQVIEQCEVDVDITHLRPHRRRVDVLSDIAAKGTRVIAVSDTYYSESSLHRLLDHVVGAHHFAAVYSSADIGLTKHSGALYPEVARREGVAGHRILHIGDNFEVDVQRAQTASWNALHVPRPRPEQALRRVARLTSAAALTSWWEARR